MNNLTFIGMAGCGKSTLGKALSKKLGVECVDTDSLIDGLNNDKVSGYLSDVLEFEPISNNEPLIGLDNVIITPHVGSRTYQSVEKQALMSIRNLIKQLK